MRNFIPKNLRKTVLEMAFSGSTVHIACAFSIIEIVSVIYDKYIHLGHGQDDIDRDIFILSKGHGVMALYACLREIGYLNEKDILNYFKDGTVLKGLSDSHVNGLDATTGSLGHGLSVAAGIALGFKIKKSSVKVFCLVGDGEANEGSIWEALLFANHWKLDNLIVIFDCNGYQAMGTTDEVMGLGSLKSKLESFGFETKEVDGHNVSQIDDALSHLTRSFNNKPKAIIAETIKGYGVSFMANDNKWHYTRLSPELYQKAISELE